MPLPFPFRAAGNGRQNVPCFIPVTVMPTYYAHRKNIFFIGENCAVFEICLYHVGNRQKRKKTAVKHRSAIAAVSGGPVWKLTLEVLCKTCKTPPALTLNICAWAHRISRRGEYNEKLVILS